MLKEIERLDTTKTSHSSNMSITLLRKNVNVICRVILDCRIIKKLVYFCANSKLADISQVYENDSQ